MNRIHPFLTSFSLGVLVLCAATQVSAVTTVIPLEVISGPNSGLANPYARLTDSGYATWMGIGSTSSSQGLTFIRNPSSGSKSSLYTATSVPAGGYSASYRFVDTYIVPYANETGSVNFAAAIIGPNALNQQTNYYGIWNWTAGTQTRVLQSGLTTVPGLGSTTFNTLQFNQAPVSSINGTYLSFYGGTDTTRALYAGAAGNQRRVWASNSSYNLNGSPVTLNVPVLPQMINNSGMLISRLNYTQSSQAKSALFSYDTTATSPTLNLLVADGMNAPVTGRPGGSGTTWFSSPGAPELNNSGQIAFAGGILSSFNFTQNLFVSNAARTSYTEVIKTGGATGLGSGESLAFAGNGFAHNYLFDLNDAGQVALVGTVNGAASGTNRGIWVGLPGDLQKVMRLGDAAAGVAGATFSSLSYSTLYGNTNQFTAVHNDVFSVNDSGQVAFFAQVAGTGVTTANDFGIWIWDPTYQVNTLIVREGDQLQLDTLGMKTVAELYSPYTLTDANSDWFNNSGQIVFGAKFTDGSVATILTNTFVAVPEPSTWALLAGAVALAAARLRRRD